MKNAKSRHADSLDCHCNDAFFWYKQIYKLIPDKNTRADVFYCFMQMHRYLPFLALQPLESKIKKEKQK